MQPFKRISGQKAWLLGVLGGLAHTLDVPAFAVRLIFLALCLATFGVPLVFVYFVVGGLAPEWGEGQPEGFKE